MHCNFREPGFEYKDDLRSGIQSAITGGFTSVLLMPQTKPVVDSRSNVEFIKNNTKGSIVDVHTSGSITKNLEGNDLVEMHDMNSAKCSIYDDKKSLNEMKVEINSYTVRILTVNYELSNDKSIYNNGKMNKV